MTLSSMADMRRAYTVVLTRDPDDGTYTVTVPALPGVVTQGDTIEHALEMAQDAIALHVRGLIEDGLPVPAEESAAVVTRVVQVAA